MAVRTEETARDVRYRRVSKLAWRYWGRILVTLFVLWHFFAIAVWSLPAVQNNYTFVAQVVREYLTTTGFNQGWTMFAPDPYSLDVYVECRIHYADGSVRSWNYPRMYDYSYFVRYQKERWRKYVEVANQDKYSFLWPSMAKYAARVNNKYPNNPPVEVDLIRHSHIVQPPDSDTKDEPWQTFQFRSVPIAPEDLK